MKEPKTPNLAAGALEGPSLDALAARAKRQIRQRMQAVRIAVPASARALRSAKLCKRVLELEELGSAARVALFWPMLQRGEVDLRAVDDALRARGAEVFYPCMREDTDPHFGFARLRDEGVAEVAAHGFRQPPASEPLAAPGEIDVIVVPALAVSPTGHRLGYGAGFYDRVLGAFRPPALAVAVAFDFQLLAELPVTVNDVACDIVVTDERTLKV